MASASIWIDFFKHLASWFNLASIKIFNRLSWVLYCSQTSAVRFWFGFASIGFASFLCSSETVHFPTSEYVMMIKIAPHNVWAVAFTIHGLSLWYGVFSRSFNKLLLILESILGTAIWFASAFAVIITQGSFGGQLAGALISFWLLVRYPTHWEQS